MTEPLVLFDTHAHLSTRMFPDGVEPLVERARAAGVRRITTIGAGDSVEVAEEAVAVAERFDDVYATVGLHPHGAASASDALFARIEELAAHPKVRAIGETGLDYHYMTAPKDVQQAALRTQIRLARRVGLPIVIHNRDSDDDCVRILREEGADAVGGVIHCFTATWEMAAACLELGFHISLSGIVTFKNARELQDVARRLPADRVLVETDAPFLAPVPKRGKTNEPAYVAHTARFVAELRGEDAGEFARQAARNGARFYGIDDGFADA